MVPPEVREGAVFRILTFCTVCVVALSSDTVVHPLHCSEAGVITDLCLDASLPYNMSIGGTHETDGDSVHVTSCCIHRSIQITDIVIPHRSPPHR